MNLMISYLLAPEKKLRFVTPLVTKVMLPNGTVHNTVKLIWNKYDNTMEDGFHTNISCTDPLRVSLVRACGQRMIVAQIKSMSIMTVATISSY